MLGREFEFEFENALSPLSPRFRLDSSTDFLHFRDSDGNLCRRSLESQLGRKPKPKSKS